MKKTNTSRELAKVDISNHNRVLLTELIPYEVPILLTNEGFYKNQAKNHESLLLEKILSQHRETNPFIYKIVKTKDSHRTLHLIHPSNQKSFVNFYKKYHNLISSLSSNSETSLRAPHEVSSKYYDPALKVKNNALKDEGAEAQTENTTDKQFKYSSSFFTYKKYDFLYKFYDSYEFHRIEKKYKKLIKFDISKCFDHISTKRLGEALKGELYQKENNLKHNFENTFSKLMEQANFGRTNGIVIGPEISRIFAEIILQRIDMNALEQCKNHKNLFEIRRYVDDYFLFYNNNDIGKSILKEFELALENFKLYLNESKISFRSAPFLTGITMAKKDIQDIFSSLFESFDKSKIHAQTEQDDGLIDNDESPDEKIQFIRFTKSPGVVANRLIRDLKAIVQKNEIEFESITGYFFTVVKNKSYEIFSYSENLSKKEQDNLFKFIQVIIDLSFFVYSMDVRVRSTYLISQISIICCRTAKNLSQEYQEEIIKRIQDEISLIVKHRTPENSPSGVEVVNLIIALREISDDEDLISSDDLIRFIANADAKNLNNLNYFQIIAALFYTKNGIHHRELKKTIKQIITQKISKLKPSLHAETAHLLLDSLSCPYLSTAFKVHLIKLAYIAEEMPPPTSRQLKIALKETSTHDWFVDWSEDGLKIEKLLNKKELKTPYS